MFVVFSISFVAAKMPAAPDNVPAKANAAMERNHPHEAIALLQQLAVFAGLKSCSRDSEC